MPDLKIKGQVTTRVREALAPHVQAIFDNPGKHLMCIVELKHAERTEPAPGEEKSPSVVVKIVGLEVANADQDEVIRQIQSALYLHRTARGTLDEATGVVDLSPRTLELTVGNLDATEVARLRTGVLHWQDTARRLAKSSNLLASELLHEIDAIATGLEHVAFNGPGATDDDD
jgi:hypothetical protein